MSLLVFAVMMIGHFGSTLGRPPTRAVLVLCLSAVAIGATLACAGFSILHTTVPAPSLSPTAVAELPTDFAGDVLVLVAWEKFDYVYGEGGEQREGFVLAPPKVLERSQLIRLGMLTKKLPYSRKTVDGKDEGSWERGHRAHGLMLVSASGYMERFLAKTDPPRDFEVAWRKHASGRLSAADLLSLADSLDCAELIEDGGECGLGSLAPLFSPDTLTYHDPDEETVLRLIMDEARTEAAASFLRSIDIGL